MSFADDFLGSETDRNQNARILMTIGPLYHKIIYLTYIVASATETRNLWL